MSTTKVPNGTVRYEYNGRYFGTRERAERAAVKDGWPNTHDDMAKAVTREVVVGGQWVSQ